MNELTFYTHPWSRGRITRWMLEECQAQYTTKVLEYGTTMKSPEYLALNLMGKIPALQVGDHVITENAAICTYLADAFPEKGLAPDVNSPLRGEYYRWLFLAAGPLEAAATAHQLGTLPTAEHYQMVGYGNIDNLVTTLEKALEGKEYICGDRFSTADLYLSSCLRWYMEFGSVPKHDVFVNYVERHTQRPAALCAAEMDDALLQKYPMP